MSLEIPKLENGAGVEGEGLKMLKGLGRAKRRAAIQVRGHRDKMAECGEAAKYGSV